MITYINFYSIDVYVALVLMLSGFIFNKIHCEVLSQKTVLLFEVSALVLLAGVVSYDLSLRPNSTIGDTSAYYDFYRELALYGADDGLEPAFVFLAKFLIYFDFTHLALFRIAPFIIAVSYYVLAKIIFGKNSFAPLLLVSFLVFYPFFWSFSANILRQGFAVSFLSLSFSALLLGRQWVACVCLVLACLFHKSALIFLPCVIFLPLFVNISFFKVFAAWIVVSLLSFTGMFNALSAFIFGQLAEFNIAANYSNFAEAAYVTGFRWKFWLFSSFPVMCILLYMKILVMPSDKAKTFINFIAFLGIVHIALFDIAFNDRFGIYAWFYYPVIVALIVRVLVERLRGTHKVGVVSVDAP